MEVTVETRARRVIADFQCVAIETVTLEKTLIELGFDSLGRAAIFVELEGEFDVRLDRIANSGEDETVGAIIAALTEHAN